MIAIPPLDSLGPRIIILGPSNSGKSTLAQGISHKQNLPVIHLDRLYHYPNSNWEPRPFEEFSVLHDHAIHEEHWVMEGNYTKILPARLACATGVILLDSATIMSLLRYGYRTFFQKEARLGALSGNQDSLKWNMIRHIAITTPKNRKRYLSQYPSIMLPKCYLSSRSILNKAYKIWGLEFPSKIK